MILLLVLVSSSYILAQEVEGDHVVDVDNEGETTDDVAAREALIAAEEEARRLEAARLDAAREEAEQLAAEQAARIKQEKEAAAQAERKRLAMEAAQKAEEERLATLKAEEDRLAAEAAAAAEAAKKDAKGSIAALKTKIWGVTDLVVEKSKSLMEDVKSMTLTQKKQAAAAVAAFGFASVAFIAKSAKDPVTAAAVRPKMK